MATLYLYSGFSKRENSTKRPSGSADASVSIDLLTIVSLKKPRFLLSSSYLTNNYTYALFEGRYYFLDEPTIVNGDLIEMNGTIDAMATYRSEIEALNAYIAYYSGSSENYIADTRLSEKINPTVRKLNYATGYNNSAAFTNQRGSVVLSVIGSDSDAFVGGVEMYASDAGNLVALADQLITNQTLQAEVKEFLDSAYDAITDAFWVPFNCEETFLGQSKVEIKVGDRVLPGIEAYPLIWQIPLTPTLNKSTPRYNKTFKFANYSYGDFRDYPPYSRLVAYFPFIGNQELDATRLAGDAIIDVFVTYDYVGGYLEYVVMGETSGYRQMFDVDVKTDISVGTIKRNRLMGSFDVVDDLLDLGKNILNKNVFGAVKELGAVVKDGLQAQSVDKSSKGKTSGNMALARQILASPISPYDTTRNVNIYKLTNDLSDNPSTFKDVIGKPYFKDATISSLGTGNYIQCSNASVEINGSEEERRIINNYLNGGFFYE